MKTKLLVPLIALLLFAGCVGTPFRWETARKIQVGMTKAEVTTLMGNPAIMTTAGESEIWTWSYGTGLGTGAAFKIVIKGDKVTEVPKIPGQF
jgi:hypothetical protein